MGLVLVFEILVHLYANLTQRPSATEGIFTIHRPFPLFYNVPRYVFEPVSGYQMLSDFPSEVLPSCTLCNFTARNARPNSSPRDVIVASMFDHIVNVVPFVRTLRTTGSRATVIFFTDKDGALKVNADLASFFHSCAITLIKIDRRQAGVRHNKQLRHLLFAEFFRTRYFLFDRILTVDLFDTVFQGDPFFEGFNRDAISFDHYFYPPFGNVLNGILAVIGPPDEKIRQEVSHRDVINSGLTTGGIELQMRFWVLYRQLLLTLNITVLNAVVYADQDLVNALIRSNATLRAGIPIVLYDAEDYFHLADKQWLRKGVVPQIGQYKMPETDVFPLVIHQADRSPPLTVSIVQACPQEFPQSEVYLRGLRKI
jgi:hypothetical protein